MKFRFMSDLHLEYYSSESVQMFLPSHEDDSDSTLILAGDIGVISKPSTIKPFMLSCAEQFKYVVMVPGNHEFYNGCITNGVDMLTTYFKDVSNIFILNNESVTLDGIKIIGSTLWTDFNKNDPVSKSMAINYMSDYALIKNNPPSGKWERITPDIIYDIHVNSLEYIVNELSKDGDSDPVVVVTHHMPSYMSVHSKYAGHKSNAFFASELYDLICKYKPSVWVHGHTHDSMDYMIEDTRVLCNPKGYPIHSDINDNFDVNKSFKVVN